MYAMRGYACPNCGAKQKEKMKPPVMAKTLCPICGKPLTVKMNDTETIVIAKIAFQHGRRIKAG